jgi:hypothetical protein
MMTDEIKMIWKEAALATQYPGIHLERLKKIMKSLSQEDR